MLTGYSPDRAVAAQQAGEGSYAVGGHALLVGIAVVLIVVAVSRTTRWVLRTRRAARARRVADREALAAKLRAGIERPRREPSPYDWDEGRWRS